MNLERISPVPFRAVAALLVVLTASLTANIALLSPRPLSSSRLLAPLAGLAAPTLTATKVSSTARETLTYDDAPTPTALYVFMPGCSWCARNRANIEALAKQTEGRFRFVALSLDQQGVEPSLNRLGIGFPAFFAASDLFVQTLRLNSTPQLVVISRKGVVQASWTGAWSGLGQQEIEKFFQVHLPGLLPPPSKG